MVHVDAIFSDYDGTLCALELRREDAFIAPRLRRVLIKASKEIKLGIVTTKDLAFIKDRVPFAHELRGNMRIGDASWRQNRRGRTRSRTKQED